MTKVGPVSTAATAASKWPTAPCPTCREMVIPAIDLHGQLIRLDPQPCSDGDLALVNKGSFAPLAYKPKPHLAFGRRLRRQHALQCLPVDPLRPPARHRPGSQPVVRPHPFKPLPAIYDPAIDNENYPPDPYTGRLTCETCRALGAPGDQRHPIDLSPPTLSALPASLAAAAAARDAAVLGEKPEEDQ